MPYSLKRHHCLINSPMGIEAKIVSSQPFCRVIDSNRIKEHCTQNRNFGMNRSSESAFGMIFSK